MRKLERERDGGKVRRAGRTETVGQWLEHWVENVGARSVRPKTLAGYRTAVNVHLILGLGAHRLDKLLPEHIERFDTRLLATGRAPATVHQVHRTLRTALNEAVRRSRIATNPAQIARSPRLVEAEIEPFTMDGARQLLGTAIGRRNGARWALALSLGLRQGDRVSGLLACRPRSSSFYASTGRRRTRSAARRLRVAGGRLAVRSAQRQADRPAGRPPSAL